MPLNYKTQKITNETRNAQFLSYMAFTHWAQQDFGKKKGCPKFYICKFQNTFFWLKLVGLKFPHEVTYDDN